jgi:iron-sulfur cluster assembly protein
MFTLTPAAARQITQAATASGAQNMALRVAATTDAEGGLQYGMGFDDAQENDMNLVLDGVPVVIAEHHQALLEDTTLDYVELEPGQFNFIFIPGSTEALPEPASAAGCGSGGCGSCGGGSAR